MASALTIGIPEKKGPKYLYVFLNNVIFEKESNYFITCKYEPVYPPNNETHGRTLRTEVQRNTRQPEFKTRNFSFKINNFYQSPTNQTPTTPFSQSISTPPFAHKNEKPSSKIPPDETNPTIILQVEPK